MKKRIPLQVQHIVLLVIFHLLTLGIHAQNINNYEDVVYLNNGNIYRGLIIEQVPNVSLKIQTHDRNVFAVQLSEIEKITKEEIPNNFYRNAYFSNDLSNSSTSNRLKNTPTKLNGVYLNWGLGLGGSSIAGAILEMSVGGKIFTKKAKESTKKAILGADAFGFIGGIVGSGIAGIFDFNAGPTWAWRLKEGYKGNLYLTPYSGININPGYNNNNDNKYGDYHFTGITFPVGLKFEYNRGRLICGSNASLGVGVEKNKFFKHGETAVAGRFMLFVGVKF